MCRGWGVGTPAWRPESDLGCFTLFAGKVMPLMQEKNCQAKKEAQIHYGALIFLILKLDMNIEFDAELVLRLLVVLIEQDVMSTINAD